MAIDDTLWQACLLDLKHELDETEYRQWLLPLGAVVQGDTLHLKVINEYFVKHIKKNHEYNLIQLVKKHSQGAVVNVKLEVMQAVAPAVTSPKKPKSGGCIEQSCAIDENYTFDNFVRGKSNTLAYNACYDMAKKAQDSSYASLFIYGVSGVGKTHLMHSVVHRYQKNGKKVCFFSSNGFMSKVGRAFLEKNIINFQKSVLEAELLIFDDIQMIPPDKKTQTANIMLNLHSDFVKSGKRVILASDRPPMALEGFDSRFLSRFSEGLAVAIDPPEMETRVQILEKKAANLHLDLPKECAIFIAQNVSPDVRRLEGALNKVHAGVTMLGRKIDLDMVREAIKEDVFARAHSINSDSIKDMVAEYYGISVKELVGKKRARHIARPRQIAMALTRQFVGDSYPEIGQAFGGRDHTTVMHACEKVEQLRAEDPNFDKDYKVLSSTLDFF